MISPDQWSTIRSLVTWLDENNGRSDAEIGLRILKLSEEVGEVAQAWIGYTGQNPRKGVTHEREDVVAELCDVMVTAAVALASVAISPQDVFDAKLAKIAARAGTVASCPGYKAAFQTESDAKRRFPNCKHCGQPRAAHPVPAP
jgi:NTP pyrophosphatase (non-canonical NTP hydrolase)